MSTIIRIDTTRTGQAQIILEHAGKQVQKETVSGMLKAQMVLPLLESMLGESNLTVKDISEIYVKDNEGSMTGIRVGFAIGNALGYLLDIPVNGKRAIAIPRYEPLIYKEVIHLKGDSYGRYKKS
jgi:tRNA threonylcarbamoyladenosine biosynthesis protein TsaB